MLNHAKKLNSQSNSFSELFSHRIREGLLIFGLALSFYLLIALVTYHISDPGWSHTGLGNKIANVGGKAGAWFSDVFLYLFGYFAYLFPAILAYGAWAIFKNRFEEIPFDYRIILIRTLGFAFILTGGCSISSLEITPSQIHLPFSSGGILGSIIGPALAVVFNNFGATLLLVALFLTGITLVTGMSWLDVIDNTGRLMIKFFDKIWKFFVGLKQRAVEFEVKTLQHKSSREFARTERIIKAPRIEPKVKQIVRSMRAEKDRQVPLFDAPIIGSLPSISLLDKVEKTSGTGYSNQQLEEISRELELRLRDFGIEAHVVAVHPGPVITRFELQLAPGIKVSKLTTLSKDLARSLSVVSVRIVEVIAGKSVVGIELPNEERETVRLSDILSSKQYDQARSAVSLALGKDISGHPVVVDLAKMPHLLVAGTTGSGKSVALNAMLLSLLYKTTPDQVRMILIDPKMLELAVYDGIPHLLTPVVTDMKEAANALRWCVAEMERRYQLMASLGVRNLAGYNNKVKEAEKKGSPLLDPLWKPHLDERQPHLQHLPYIVVLIDEYADMMIVVGKKVETLIARIAQKARAAGIHMILATQRPSVDVITGLIKANVPTRIAFQVSSKIDSRTILDQGGAEQLLGQGDMLYLAPGTGLPVRVHGAFVSDQEVHNVVADWKKRGKPVYMEEILEHHDEANGDGLFGGGSDADEMDALYDQAVEFVTHSRRVSISSVQRRFKIGYNRAARIVEDMERAGIVSTMESNGSREVLAPAPPSRD